MPLVRPLYRDALNPTLVESPAFRVTEEQKLWIREILEVCCSDSRFAEKAYVALTKVLTGGSALNPALTSLNPSTAVLGAPSFTLHVVGTEFDQGAMIVWNGGTEPTIFVSATELTTLVDMSTAQNAVDIPVQVQNSTGVISNTLVFSLTAPVLMMSAPALAPTKSSQIHESVGPSGEQKPSKESGR